MCAVYKYLEVFMTPWRMGEMSNLAYADGFSILVGELEYFKVAESIINSEQSHKIKFFFSVVLA
jgi:hypothetical protein